MCVRRGCGVMLLMSTSSLAVRIHREFSTSGVGERVEGGGLKYVQRCHVALRNAPLQTRFVKSYQPSSIPQVEANKVEFNCYLQRIERKTQMGVFAPMSIKTSPGGVVAWLHLCPVESR